MIIVRILEMGKLKDSVFKWLAHSRSYCAWVAETGFEPGSGLEAS